MSIYSNLETYADLHIPEGPQNKTEILTEPTWTHVCTAVWEMSSNSISTQMIDEVRRELLGDTRRTVQLEFGNYQYVLNSMIHKIREDSLAPIDVRSMISTTVP